MVKHYEQVNTIKNLDPNSRLTPIVNKIAEEIDQKMNEFHNQNKTLTVFSDINPSHNPTEDPEKLFVNTKKLLILLKKCLTKHLQGWIIFSTLS